MSYDLAIWMGDRPKDDAAAAATFESLHAKYLSGVTTLAPAPTMLAFLAELTKRYPDLTELDDEDVDDGVWSDAPLVNNASGPLLYLGIVHSRVDEVVPHIVACATARNLVVFDPQVGRVLTR